jgi:hypothetical protein
MADARSVNNDSNLSYMVKKLQGEAQAAGKRDPHASTKRSPSAKLSASASTMPDMTMQSMSNIASTPSWWRRLLCSAPNDTARVVDAALDDLDADEGVSDTTISSSSTRVTASSFGWSISQVSAPPPCRCHWTSAVVTLVAAMATACHLHMKR